ncbi:hypothetical protein ACMXZU_04560 [Corynebacterium striatum]
MTPDELKDHLRDTVTYIKRHRALIMPESKGYSETPAFTPFASKSPCSDNAIDAGDMELKAVARLAVYCMNKGTLPYRKISGVWWVKGAPYGVKAVCDWDEFDLNGEHSGMDVYEPLNEWIEFMRTYAPTIARTEGVEPYLDECERIRRYSKMRFPNERDVWLTLEQVAEKYGMAERTVRDWGDSRAVRVIEDDYGPRLYLESSVKMYRDEVERNRLRCLQLANERRKSA